MSLLTNPFEKQPNRHRLSELQRIVTADRLSVRALGERHACEVGDAIFPGVSLGDELIEKINANQPQAKTNSTEAAGRAAIATQAPVAEQSPLQEQNNVIPITAAKSYEAPAVTVSEPAQTPYPSMEAMAEAARSRVEAARNANDKNEAA